MEDTAQEEKVGDASADTTENESAAVAEPTIDELKAAVEAEKSLRVLAEGERDNAKKDIVAIKTGKKRGEIDLTQVPEPKKTDEKVDYAAALAEKDRVIAELARSMTSRGIAPTGGSGQAESPAPKPKGYWSEAQKAFLRERRGMSDAMIAKAEKLASQGGATGARTSIDAGIPKRTY